MTPLHRPHKGFTLIELLLLVSIISFITISSLAGFSVSSNRLKFQNQSNNLKSTLDSIRNEAFAETNPDVEYITNIKNDSISAGYLNNKTTEKSEVTNSQITTPLEIHEVYLKPISQDWQEIDLRKNPFPIQITYNSKNRKCYIRHNETGPNQLIQIHIPLYNTESPSTPINHLYINRENCLSELLSQPIAR